MIFEQIYSKIDLSEIVKKGMGMKVKNHKILLPAIAVAVLALGGGYYGTQLVNKQNLFSKALAYTSAVNPVDPSNAPDSYEIKFTDNNFKRALNSVLMKTDTSRNLDSPITVGAAKKMTGFWPDAPYRNFQNLEGIQYFTNLEVIHVAGMSSLKDISAAETLTKIKTAYLSSSNIADMSAVKNWKQVELLWIHDNPITDFSFLKELPRASVWGVRSNARIKVQKGQKVFKNPFINFDGKIMPIVENDNFINADADGNPKQDGGYIKIIKPVLKGNFKFEVYEKNDTLPSGNKFNLNFSKSTITVEGIDINSTEKPVIKFENTPLSENSTLTIDKTSTKLTESVLNDIKNSLVAEISKTSGYYATSATTKITSFTNDADKVLNDQKNQLNGDFVITSTAVNEYGNSTTVKVHLILGTISRDLIKDALKILDNQPDYIKNDIPKSLIAAAKQLVDKPLTTEDEIKTAADNLKNKIKELLDKETENQKKAEDSLKDIQKNIDDDTLKTINSEITNAENLISKVKNENKRKELTEKLQKIKELIDAKKVKAKAEADKPKLAEEKHSPEVKNQHVNSPETGFLRESKRQQDKQNNILILVGLVIAIIAPVAIALISRKKKNPKK